MYLFIKKRIILNYVFFETIQLLFFSTQLTILKIVMLLVLNDFSL